MGRENAVPHAIVLASASPRRREILSLADLEVQVVPSQVDEETKASDPKEVVETLARRKAKDIAAHGHDRDMVVGADTVVAFQGEILGKPKDEEDAKRMLRRLSGCTHQVFTGVCICEKGKEISFVQETKVVFYPMTDEEIDDYITTGEPLDKAGGYGIQGKAARFVKEIHGDYYNVVGFPLARFLREIL